MIYPIQLTFDEKKILGWLKKYFRGWWLTYPSEKYEFVSWDFLFPIDGKS